jgi:uncharacterized protein (TIGR02266 family)
MHRVPIVFPVRFATRNAAVQTTTRELSAEGVFVRCLEPPPRGTPIAMKLYLPGKRDGMSVEAVIAEVTPPGSEAGFWAEFTGLSAHDRGELLEQLARRERAAASKPIGAIQVQPMAAGDDSRRAFPRIAARFAVRFATVQDFVLEYAANISAGGVFVHSLDPPPLKSIVRVEMELPGGGGTVPARGVVVHRVDRAEAEAKGTLPGMGVQFIDSDDEFRSKIDAAIAKILGE